MLYHSGRLFANFAYLQTMKLAAVAPDSVWLHQAAGEANESQGLHDAALREYRQVLKVAPRRPGIHFRIGRVLLKRSSSNTSADDVRDIDLLMSGRDARAALLRVGVPAVAGQATDLFRSAVFGTWNSPPLPVEIFGDFEFVGPAGWSRVDPESRDPVPVASKTLYVPSVPELRQILIGFGRPKDLARARLLPSRSRL